MEFGVRLPMFGNLATRDTILQIATSAEDLGFDSIWAGDHLAFTETIPNTYPFSQTGEPPDVLSKESNALEVFTSLAYVAGETNEISVGTNTCIPPLRHPVYLTKVVFTLEALAPHRFDFGVAPGWMKSEFDVFDVPYEKRGPMTDEFLDIFSTATVKDSFSFDGNFYSFQETGFLPQPDGDRPKIWIGGNSQRAFSRLAKFGDGWTTLWTKPNELAARRDDILEVWEEHERATNPDIAVMRPISMNESATNRSDKPLVGDADSIIDDVVAYEDHGCTRLIINFYSTNFDVQMDQLEQFGERILPSFK